MSYSLESYARSTAFLEDINICDLTGTGMRGTFIANLANRRIEVTGSGTDFSR